MGGVAKTGGEAPQGLSNTAFEPRAASDDRGYRSPFSGRSGQAEGPDVKRQKLTDFAAKQGAAQAVDQARADARGARLTGDGGSNFLEGGEGDDAIYGGDGVDWLRGEAGADFLSGGAGADVLSGGAGADILLGGAGGDRLDAGAGAGLMIGGEGRDVFAISDGVLSGSAQDLVIAGDFDPAQDRFDFGPALSAALKVFLKGGDSPVTALRAGADVSRLEESFDRISPEGVSTAECLLIEAGVGDGAVSSATTIELAGGAEIVVFGLTPETLEPLLREMFAAPQPGADTGFAAIADAAQGGTERVSLAGRGTEFERRALDGGTGEGLALLTGPAQGAGADHRMLLPAGAALQFDGGGQARQIGGGSPLEQPVLGRAYNVLSDSGLQLNASYDRQGLAEFGVRYGADSILVGRGGEVELNGAPARGDGLYLNGRLSISGGVVELRGPEHMLRIDAQQTPRLTFAASAAAGGDVPARGLWAPADLSNPPIQAAGLFDAQFTKARPRR